MRTRHSIKATISLSVLLLGLLLIVLDKSRNEKLLVERGVARMEREAQVTGMRLSGVMQYLFRNQLQRVAELEMSYATVSQDLVLGLVCDEEDIVRFATRLQWRGQKLTDTPLAEAAAWPETGSGVEGMTRWDEDREHLLTVFPFFTGYDLDDRGVVVLAYDSSLALERARGDAMQESIVRACLLAVACLLLWLVLDWLVARRVAQVLEYTQAVKTGLDDAEPPEGRDELGLIARSFADAVRKLRETGARLMEASDAERRRIGRDIHDDVCQRISAAQLKSGVLSHLLARESSSHSRLAAEVARELHDASIITRAFARGLAPVWVEKEGLAAALAELGSQVTLTYGVACEVDSALGETSPALWVQTHVFRIVQELVTNAAKHAHASRIDARVVIADGWLRIEVENDGVSFVPEGEEVGLGLQFLRQRAQALGGHLEFHAREDGGTLALCETRIADIHYVNHPEHSP